ncbi:MAG: hypothetical protein KF773_25035 [Deltaproteobacteria bacterium]|nr:hypothetical protein [Deltaproteobacteria bacterium]
MTTLPCFLSAAFDVLRALAALHEPPPEVDALAHLGRTLDELQVTFAGLPGADAQAFAGLVHDLCTLVHAATAPFENPVERT